MGSVVVARQGWIKMLSGEWLGPCQASSVRSSPTSEQNSRNASSLSKSSSKAVLAESIPGLLRSAVASAVEAIGNRGERPSPGSCDCAGQQPRPPGKGRRPRPARCDPGSRSRPGSLLESHSGAPPRRASPGRTLLMVVPPDTVTGPGSGGQAGESPGSGDDCSPCLAISLQKAIWASSTGAESK